VNNGEVAILNCAEGDTRLTFDSNDESEVRRAREIVTDMLRRGYTISLLVDGEPKKMEKVTGFDPEADEYVISSPRGGSKKAASRVSAKGRRAIAVAPTAGGGLACHSLPITRDMLRR